MRVCWWFLLVFGMSFGAVADILRQFEVELKQTSYFSEAKESTHLNDYSDAFFRYYYLEKTPQDQSEVDLKGYLSLNLEKEQYFSIPNMYYRINWDHFQLTFGRKHFIWSEWDESWHQGLWEPQFRMDPLRPESQGLLGIFLQREEERFKWTLFFSTLFIPDQGPNIRVQDGIVFSNNRWFVGPSTEGSLSSAGDLYYNIYYPSLSDVIYNRTLAFQVYLGRSLGSWLSVQAAQKPKNQLSLSIDLNQSPNLKKTNVEIYPFVLFHRLYTIESGYKGKQWKFFVSWNQEEILQDNQSVPGVALLPKQSQYYGLGYQTALDFLGIPLSEIHFVTFRQVKTNKEISLNSDEEKIKELILRESLLEDSTLSHLFENALKFGASKNVFFSGGKKIIISFDYVWDVQQDGRFFTASLNYQPSQRWSFYMGADVLSQNKQSMEDKGFFSEFKGNDRVFGGFSYVF
ncbi:MAG: hypothetical protein D6797_03015 [Bdellovibrio sp.]|nr:MAG: hypothetical protein D6797_03015 [Bdellovibrio sp.]